MRIISVRSINLQNDFIDIPLKMLIDGDFQKIMPMVVSTRCDRSRWVRSVFFFVYILFYISTYYLYRVCVWGEFELFEEFINHYVFYYCYIYDGGVDGVRETCDADGLQNTRIACCVQYNIIFYTAFQR